MLLRSLLPLHSRHFEPRNPLCSINPFLPLRINLSPFLVMWVIIGLNPRLHLGKVVLVTFP